MIRCRTCGQTYSEFGDGWDGECPECADKTYAAECGTDEIEVEAVIIQGPWDTLKEQRGLS